MLGMKRKQEGDGVFMRDPGKLPPAGRQLLAQVGNEPITSIEIVRTPLSSFTKGFLNVISLGQFEKISKKYYDEMFHLSLWINGKYNLEKNEVVNFSRKNPKEAKSQSKPINQIPSEITLQQLIDNTIKRMGPQNFSTYDAQNLNCQNFLVNILDANNIGDSSDKSFIVQDADKIFKELPEFSKVLGNAATNLGAIFNRLIKGEGEENFHKMPDGTIMPGRIHGGMDEIVEIADLPDARTWWNRYRSSEIGEVEDEFIRESTDIENTIDNEIYDEDEVLQEINNKIRFQKQLLNYRDTEEDLIPSIRKFLDRFEKLRDKVLKDKKKSDERDMKGSGSIAHRSYMSSLMK